MKKSFLILFVVCSFCLKTHAVSIDRNDCMSTNSVSLVQTSQMGSGLIKSVVLGDSSNGYNCALRIFLTHHLDHVRIDWIADETFYSMIYTVGYYDSYVDVPCFCDYSFRLCAEETNVDYNDNISRKAETRYYDIVFY